MNNYVEISEEGFNQIKVLYNIRKDNKVDLNEQEAKYLQDLKNKIPLGQASPL